MTTPRELGALLRSRRRAVGESQQVTAAALGVTRQWLARVELGTGNPDLRQVFALCDHLGLHLTASPSGSPVAAVPETTASRTRLEGRAATPESASPPSRARGSALSPQTGRVARPDLRALGRGGHAVPDVDLDRLLASFTGTVVGTPRVPAQSAAAKDVDRHRG